MKFSKFVEKLNRGDKSRLMDLEVVVENAHLNTPAIVVDVEVDREQGCIRFKTDGAFDPVENAEENAGG